MVSRVFLLVKSQTESKEPILKVEVTCSRPIFNKKFI